MSIEPYLSGRPLAADDLKAVATAFGLGPRSAVRELTPAQKAQQEAKLAPYLRVSPYASPLPSRRSEGARRGRLKVLARRAAERDEAQS